MKILFLGMEQWSSSWKRYPILFWNCSMIVFVVWVMAWMVQTPLEKSPVFGKSYGFCSWERSWLDFTVHFQFAKAIQERATERPFTYEGQLQIYQHWIGEIPHEVMPSAYFPTYYFLMGMFSGVKTAHVYFLWNLFAVIIWFLATQKMQKNISPLTGTALSATVIISTTGYAAIFFGQTALLSTGLLILLVRPESVPSRGRFFLTALIIFLLFSKPPTGLLGCAILFFEKRYRELGVALGFVGLVTMVFCWKLGSLQSLIDYVSWIQNYNFLKMREPFQASLAPAFQTNFISWASQNELFDSALLLRFNQAGILIWVLFGVILYRARKFSFYEVPIYGAWIYLLWSPQLSMTEDLMLAWVLYVIASRMKRMEWIGLMGMIFLYNTSQTFAPFYSSFFYSHPTPWILKMILFALWIGRLFWQPPREKVEI